MWSPRRRLPPRQLDVCHPNGLFNSKVDEGAATRGLLFGRGFQEGSRRRLGLQRTRQTSPITTTHLRCLWRRQHHDLPTTQNAFLQSYKYEPGDLPSAFTSLQWETGARQLPAMGDRVTDRDRPLTSETGEINITK